MSCRSLRLELAGSPLDLVFLGDVVLAEETVSREAREQSIPLASTISRTWSPTAFCISSASTTTSITAAERMERIEAAILAELEIADPYFEPEQKEALDRSHAL